MCMFHTELFIVHNGMDKVTNKSISYYINVNNLNSRAIDENKEQIAIFLIQSGCDLDCYRLPGPNGEGGDEARDRASPLHLCCQWGLDSVVQTLVEHGANVNSRDAENKTPLHIAIENQHPTIITLLLFHPNIDLSLRDKAGLSPFATALTFRNNKAAQAILDKLPSAAEQVTFFYYVYQISPSRHFRKTLMPARG